MPIHPQGLWISPSYETHYTGDHYTYILNNLRVFGITPSDIKRIDVKDPLVRESIIKEVIRNGWIRVRSDGVNFAMEVWRFSDSIAFNVKMFLTESKFPKDRKILIEEISTGATFYEPAQWFYTDESLGYTRNVGKQRRRK